MEEKTQTQTPPESNTKKDTPRASKRAEKKAHRWDIIHKDWAATVILCGVVLIIVAALFVEASSVRNILQKILDVFQPIIIGVVIAFVLYKPTIFLERLYGRAKQRHPRFPATALAVLTAYVLLIVLITLLVRIIWPQFVSSILDFGSNILVYYNNALDYLSNGRGATILDFLNDNGIDLTQIRTMLVDLTSYIPTILSAVSSWTYSLLGGLLDVVIGLFFSIYVLGNHKRLKRQGKRLTTHFLSAPHYATFHHYGTMIFRIFSDFINGVIIDSLVVGIVTFIVISIVGIEYPLMIAVVIGVTNIIPVVGPLIGAIPCTLILLTVNPFHAIIFVIIILIIQQLDGHLLKVYIFGSSLGLPSVWVLFAIIVGGNIGGAVGMLLGVPIMSVIYTILAEKTADTSSPEDKTERKSKSLHPIRLIRTLIKRYQHRHAAPPPTETSSAIDDTTPINPVPPEDATPVSHENIPKNQQ